MICCGGRQSSGLESRLSREGKLYAFFSLLSSHSTPASRFFGWQTRWPQPTTAEAGAELEPQYYCLASAASGWKQAEPIVGSLRVGSSRVEFEFESEFGAGRGRTFRKFFACWLVKIEKKFVCQAKIITSSVPLAKSAGSYLSADEGRRRNYSINCRAAIELIEWPLAAAAAAESWPKDLSD